MQACSRNRRVGCRLFKIAQGPQIEGRPIKRKAFCLHLSEWLDQSVWHYTTLLAATIESVESLPDDADSLITDLLLRFPDKPPKRQILDFLCSHKIVSSWFQFSPTPPRVTRFNIDPSTQPEQVHPGLPVVDSSEQLAYWLGLNINQLQWLADYKRPDYSEPGRYRHYHYSTVQKRRGGLRLIESPKRLLKQIQRQINVHILRFARIHEAAHGFRRHRSCITHARLHVKKNTLYVFDVANYFLSIGWYQVYLVFTRLGYSQEVAKMLTGLCTHRCTVPRELGSDFGPSQIRKMAIAHLPQGAPTSPSLSNAVMYQLDCRLNGVAKSLDLTYSRYADDLAFSGNQHRGSQFLESLIGAICLEEGFELNYRKSRQLRKNQRQKLTGIVVNQHTNIDRRYYDNLKATLTNCVRQGADCQNRSGHPNFRQHLLGSIQHVSSLNSAKGEKLQKIFKEIVF